MILLSTRPSQVFATSDELFPLLLSSLTLNPPLCIRRGHCDHLFLFRAVFKLFSLSLSLPNRSFLFVTEKNGGPRLMQGAILLPSARDVSYVKEHLVVLAPFGKWIMRTFMIFQDVGRKNEAWQ